MRVTGKTSNPTLIAISLAEYINKRNSGAVVAPWNLDNLPDEWLDAYRVLKANETPAKWRNPLEHVFERARRAHPTYRKYR